MDGLDSVVKEFLAESHENLDRLDRDLVALEKAPRDGERLASVFRTIHTIKGTCGFLGFTRLGALTHAGEELLSHLRDGTLPLTPAVTSGLLALGDAVRATLKRIDATDQEGDEGHLSLIAELERLRAGETPDLSREASEGGDESPRGPEPLPGGGADSTVRVDVALLDRLMRLVGELVLARNQLVQLSAGQDSPALQSASLGLSLITTELQEGVMKTRMQPVGSVWKAFPRLARDVALACEKQVRIDLEGEQTDLDRTLLEAIKDPLTHLVRNAIDHGIETPERRQALGKPPEGHLLLRAFHEGGQVHIEIADDGGGIDRDRVKSRALQRGLLTPEQAGRLDDRELLDLVFKPGFSTADRVTDLSGRGVGMDVVKTNIEKIGGSVTLESRPGLGTTVKLKIPLTLAIIPALVVSCAGDRYALPRGSVLELVRLDAEQARRHIEDLCGAAVYCLRGSLLPLARLGDVLGVAGRRAEGEAFNIAVLQAGGRRFGLLIDGVSDTEEIVVKPLPESLRGVNVYAGATILGDGRVALILDVMGLAQGAGVLSERTAWAIPATSAAGPVLAARTPEGRQSLLVCSAGDGRRVALPLQQVERLEVFEPSAVERAAGAEVVQYRGGLLPLKRLGHTESAGPLHVVVCSGQGRSVGLVVERILDTVEEEEIPSPGTPLGSRAAVIQRKATELIDPAEILAGPANGDGG